MKTIKQKLVTIITEQNLEKGIIQDLESLGVEGYTIAEVKGKGGGGVKSGTWMNDSNIQIKLIVCDELATKIMAYVADTKKYRNYNMMVYMSEVITLERK